MLFVPALFVVGLCSGLLDVTMNARTSEIEARSGRSLMNAAHGMFSVGYTIGALWAGLAREAGLSPFAAALAVAAVALPPLLPRMRQEPETVAIPASGSGAYPLWPILICGGIVLAAFMTEAATEAWSALHVERTLGGRAVEGALGPAMLGLTMTIGRFAGQAIVERLPPLRLLIGASLLAAGGALVAAWAASPAYAYLGFGLFGLGVSVIGPLGLALVGRMVAPHWRTHAIARAAVIGFSGFFFAPVLMGAISHGFGDDLGLRAAFSAVALVVVCAGPLALLAALRLPPVGAGAGAFSPR